MSNVRFEWIVAIVLLGGCTESVGSHRSALGADSDGDGDPDTTDCAPSDPAVHHGAIEVCNGLDDNCDSAIDEPVGTSYCAPVEAPTPDSTQCTNKLMVGLSTAGACPGAGSGWRSIFGGGIAAAGGVYCAYEHSDAHPPVQDLPWDGGRSPAAWLEPDCFVVTPQSPTDSELAALAVWEDYLHGWLSQNNALNALPGSPSPVHVAVVDSADGSTGLLGAPSRGGVSSSHGAAMGLLIDALACPEGRSRPCAAAFTNHLALPALGDGTLIADGGAIGGFAHAAAAIKEAVDGHARGPLILNLSIGAEPRFATLPSGAPRPSVEALRQILDKAVCLHDALTFAAAGNASGGPFPSTGPLLPAAWATDVTSCGKPFLVSVGGVDAQDALLAQSRPGSIPELVAPAHNAAADLSGGHGPARNPTALLSGTSLGAASASAAAAVAWSYAPYLSASDITALLQGSATPLGVGADVCTSASCDVRRVDLCAATEAALADRCAFDGSTCGFLPLGCAPIPAHSGSHVVLSAAALASLPGGASVSGAALTDVVTSPVCTAPAIGTVMSTLPANPDLCPAEQYSSPAASPLGLTSQPDTPPCRVCALEPSAKRLVMYVETGLPGVLHPPVLRTSTGEILYLSSAISGTLTGGTRYEITSLPVNPLAASAVLAFPYTDPSGKTRALSTSVAIW